MVSKLLTVLGLRPAPVPALEVAMVDPKMVTRLGAANGCGELVHRPGRGWAVLHVADEAFEQAFEDFASAWAAFTKIEKGD